MENWYGLRNEKIDEIESAIEWFRMNDEKLIHYLLEAWYVAGAGNQQFAPSSLNVPNWLDRCYALKKDKRLPTEVLPILLKELQPFRVSPNR